VSAGDKRALRYVIRTSQVVGTRRLVGLLAAGLGALALLPGAALGATPIALDVPNNGNAPQVAFDPITQNIFIAWDDSQSTTFGTIDLCVLLKNTSGCEGGGPVALTITPTENPAVDTLYLSGLTVLPNGDIVVAGNFTSGGTVTWESPGDGSAFLTGGRGLQNGGSYISSVGLFDTTGNIVALSNTDIGLLNDYYNYFSDSPFAGPEYPATLNSPNTNPPPAGQMDSLYPSKALGTDGPEIAAEPLPAPAAAGTDAVVGVGDNFTGPNTQLSDCINGDNVGTGYGVDVGQVNGNSSGTGTLNAQTNGASLPSYTGLACNAESPVVASPEGGVQGIGVLEDEGDGLDGGTTYTLDYRPFVVNSSATGGSFGGAALVAKLTEAAEAVDVVDDSTDGVYALWSAHGVFVNYSADGGAVWGPPVEIPEPTNGEISDPVITAIGGGEFLLSYDSNPASGTQTFVEGFSYQQLEQAPTAISTIQTSGSKTGGDLTIPAGTVGESDRATITGSNAASATGTVDFALYGNSSCSGTPKFAGAAEVTGGVASIADASSTGLPLGTYYWKASYGGNAVNQPSTSTCGEEKLTVGSATTIPSSATTTGSSFSFKISCPAACSVTVTIELPSGAASDARASLKKHKPVIIASGKFSLGKSGTKKLTLKLTRKGKSLLKKDHGKLKTILLVSDKTKHGTFKSSRTFRITKRK
jgi:hypothetical protein